jgi:hypothetical protein
MGNLREWLGLSTHPRQPIDGDGCKQELEDVDLHREQVVKHGKGEALGDARIRQNFGDATADHELPEPEGGKGLPQQNRDHRKPSTEVGKIALIDGRHVEVVVR